MIKIRAFDKESNQIITEDSSGLTSAQILSRYSICMIYVNMVEHECLCADPDNKIEIYEGDIVEGLILRDRSNSNSQNTKYVDEVVLQWGSFRLKESGITLNQLDTIKVIGNIHQNKNLLI